ncbi:helix-turn-helix domain-containing protein [Streptomyces noursei]|uniref:helix-turn-helix domain-containing protein n=1 Tax=Streptomyces noursei TaxID=1971 RepID=UPI002155AC3A|nr:helix-turn-helix domain-containing protein [Streptomyces noursei]
MRAQVVLHAARGRSHACIAREAGLRVDTVCRWRGRFARRAFPGSQSVNSAAVPPRSQRCRSPRSRRWPSGCLPRGKYRSHAGRARNWGARPPGGASPHSCRRRPCVVGGLRTRPGPGSTAPGSSSPAPAPG